MFNLAIKNIKNSFKSYRNIYALLLISQLVAVIILFFVYGIVASYDIRKEEQLIEETHIYATFTEPIPATSLGEILPDILSSMEGRMEYAFIPIGSMLADLDVTCIMEFHDGKYYMPTSDFSLDRLVAGRYIDEIEMNEGHRVAFAYGNKFPTGEEELIYEVGDKCELYGIDYEIIGVIDYSTNIDRVTIPITSCTEDMKVSMFDVTFYEFPTMADYNVFKDILIENYGGNVNIQDFEPVDLDDIIAYNTTIILALVIGVIAALDTILVYNYLMKKRKKQMAIYSIEGATRAQQITICTLEILAITLLTTITGVVIFKTLIENALLKVYDVSMDIFNFRIYALLLGAYLACVLFGTTCIIILNTRKKALDVRRGIG